MPQLMSHWDGLSWQTPNVADVLELPDRPLDRTGQLRSLATLIIRNLAELGAPVRLKDLEAYTSHSRYLLVPDKIGARGQERLVSQADLERALPRLLPQLGAEEVQIVTQHSDDPLITLFIRSSFNRPKRMRELLEDRSFINNPSYTTLALGLDLNQQLVLQDLATLRHLLIVGTEESRFQLMGMLAMTLALFNSPGYLRLALVGPKGSYPAHLNHLPHVLGNNIETLAGFRRLLEGLIKHIVQRRSLLERREVDTLDRYNQQALSNKDMTPLPRIWALVDAESLPEWSTKQDAWLVPFNQLLARGAEVGIHVILSSPQLEIPYLPGRIRKEFGDCIILPSAYEQLEPAKRPAPQVPHKFVDGLLMESGTTLEFPQINEAELLRLATYWQNMRTRRSAEQETQGQPVSSGNTGLLNLRSDLLPTTNVLAAQRANLPQTNTLKPPQTEDNPSPPIIPDNVVVSAQALAAYLGWLALGPLRDVLHLREDEALEVLRILRGLGILEEGEGPIWRFERLADLPSAFLPEG